MAFKFGQRRVTDPLAQQNFEQLEGTVTDLDATNADLNGRIAALEAKPQCRMTRTTQQSIPNGVWTPIVWEALEWGAGGVVGSSKLTAPKTGLYQVCGGIDLVASANGARGWVIRYNGSAFVTAVTTAATLAANQGGNPSTLLRLAKDDYVELLVFQNNGAALLTTASAQTPHFEFAWLGP